MKPAYIFNEILDERKRYISTDEFKFIMRSFRDRYDPRRLAFALMYTAGLRPKDGVTARLKWFSEDFSILKMSQCKPHINKEDNVVRATFKPRFVPLPDWLATDLKNYAQYRLMVGTYVGENLTDFRMFPKLSVENVRQAFYKLRIRHGKEQPWLNDLWMVTKMYDPEGNLIREQKWFRVSCHAGRANYCTAAFQLSENDLVKTKILTGHDQTKDVEKYVRVMGIDENKIKIKERFMEHLLVEQQIPILKGQKKLTEY